MHRNYSFLIAGLLVAFILITQAAFIVDQKEQALVYQFGKPVASYTAPGLKFKVPFLNQVRFFENRVLDLDAQPEEVILADQKRLVVDTFARWHITDMLAFSTALGNEEQAASRLNNIISSALRSTLGSATLTDLLSDKRVGLMSAIKKQVNASVSRLGIEMVDVRIGRADLPAQTSQSIYARMRTEREREAAEFRAQGQEELQTIKSKAEKERTVLMAEAEKQAQISRGEGDEAASKIYAAAYGRDPSFYEFYRTLQAYRTALDGDSTTLMLSPDSAFLRYFKDGKR